MGHQFLIFSFFLALNKIVVIPLLTPLENRPICNATLIIYWNSFPIISHKKKVEPYHNPILVQWFFWLAEILPLKVAQLT
jgi:hypothetical protein